MAGFVGFGTGRGRRHCWGVGLHVTAGLESRQCGDLCPIRSPARGHDSDGIAAG